jgi:hypothetical protein
MVTRNRQNDKQSTTLNSKERETNNMLMKEFFLDFNE